MSKFFFKGRQDKRENHGSFGFSTNRAEKPGSESHPVSVIVTSEERQAEIETILKEHSLFAIIEVNENAKEDITELESLLNTPKTIVFDKTPDRNDPCSCGSGKKYKKCCGN
ncbi:PBPRA1643 family SWIM/SEC-C metal-binding motif protein [Alkalimarinus alittae]|uniref:SEC-C metal-binding domain-containing protein n=1 Tax=Alkalimarinus alittae TaxID=2961619 RepID=A0ABY6MYN5_9ALTE|nr:PBPRA1643 family SWIM/SEC-C metal-binding motif protein [Alkalimarinus alittae]UZE94892.1 SEC-C metal-binding domain-containing protein [Alkalimarinus alittae]